ncbi:hypothetical protein FRC03_005571, partial [Tulasnella sp. 419]
HSYQWINKTSAAQVLSLDSHQEYINFDNGTNWPYPNEEATLTLTWARTGLSPGTHTIGLKHQKLPDFEDLTVLDHITIEELDEDQPGRTDNGRIIGGSVAGFILLLAAVKLIIIYKRMQAAEAQEKAHLSLAASRDVQFMYSAA